MPPSPSGRIHPQVTIQEGDGTHTRTDASHPKSLGQLKKKQGQERDTKGWLEKTRNNAITTNWRVEQYIADAKILHDGKLTMKEHVYRALASPGSSNGALLWAMIMQGFSVASVVISAYQLDREAIEVNEGLTCPRVDPNDPTSACVMDTLSQFNWIFAGIFGFELLARLLVFKKPHKDWTIWLDFLTIVPMVMRGIMMRYGIRPLEMPSKGYRTATLLVCSFTPLRMLKLGRYMKGITLLFNSLRKSMSSLVIPLYLLVVMFTFLGSLVYAAEYDNDLWDEGGRVQTISDGYWMCLVTMTTVGYGDYSPKTATGRILIGFVMLFGIVFLAMPLAIVGNTFSEAYEASASVKVSEALRKKMLEAGQDPNDTLQAFMEMDTRSRGFLSYGDFKKTVERKLRLRMTKEQLKKVWTSLDQDGSDMVAHREFQEIFFPEIEPEDVDAPTKFAESSVNLVRTPNGKEVLPPDSPSPATPVIRSGLGADDESGFALAQVEARLGAVEASLASQNALSTMLQQALTAQEEQRRAALAQQTELQQTITHLLDSRLNSVEAGVAGQNSLATLLKDSLAAQEDLRQKLVMQQAEQQHLVKQLVSSVQLLGASSGGRAQLTHDSAPPLALTE